jgi:hypothetical protein
MINSILLIVIMLIVIMLSVVMLDAVILCVLVPTTEKVCTFIHQELYPQ